MNKQVIAVSIMLVLLVVGLSGCNEQQAIITPEPNYVIMDIYEHRNSNAEIEYVYIELQNTENKPVFFEIIFTFGVIDESNLGEGHDWGGKTGDWYPGKDPHDYSYETEKQIYIPPHEINKVYCYATPQFGTNINIGWSYDITVSFS